MGIVFSACDVHDVIKTCILFSITKNDLFELICLKMICLLYYTYTLNTRKKNTLNEINGKVFLHGADIVMNIRSLGAFSLLSGAAILIFNEPYCVCMHTYL